MLIGERYRLLRLIGQGGMGRVWLARDEMLHRDVAVKEVILAQWLSDEDQDRLVARAMLEARIAARLNHPNVVSVHDVVHSGATPWIVMEYVPSRSLQDVLQSGPLGFRRAAEIGLAVLAALRAAHRAGVVHRDVKPGNVLIADDGRVMLTDFGLATLDGGGHGLTRPGSIMGSPEYVAPERAAEGVSTVGTDLWSLGATLHAAVEGRSPYARSTPMATLTALATSPPDPAPHAGALGPVLAALLARDPGRRLGVDEAEQLLRIAAGTDHQDLPSTGTGSGGTAPVPTRPANGRPRWRWWIPMAAVGLAVVTGVGTALAVTRDQAGPPASPVSGHVAPPPPGHGDGPDPDHRGQPPPPPAGPEVPPPPFPCVRPSRSNQVVSTTAQPAGERFEPPDGWALHLDDSGFRIAVPVGWRFFREDGVSCFQDPRSSRALSVGLSSPVTDDPVGQLRAEAQRAVDGGTLPGYEQIRVTATGDRRVAEWEFRWTAPYGERMHGLRVLTGRSRTQAYTLGWIGPDAEWGGDLARIAVARASFRSAA